MNLQSNKSLLSFNTLRFDSLAEHFVEANGLSDIKEAITMARNKGWPLFVLGGGSNVVLPEKIPGLTLRMCNQAITMPIDNTGEDSTVRLCAEAGVNWHQLVLTCLDRKAHGLENLSLIPGTVGAAPIQNIGAYGAELCDSFESLNAVDVETLDLVTLSREDCEFGYRDSIFKNHARNRFVICNVTFRLSKHFEPRTDYRSLQDEIESRALQTPDARTISQLICEIRSSKLPDPAMLGNAGSFFKNPVLTDAQLESIRSSWPEAPLYLQSDGSYKIAAGWMIEKAGWKGHQRGAIGVHAKQALVLTHTGGSKAADLLTLASEIKSSVQELFDVELEQEPTTI